MCHQDPGRTPSRVAALLLGACSYVTSAPAIIPVNGDFEQWESPKRTPPGWTLTNGLFPSEWLPESREGARGFLLRKANEPGTPFGKASLYLNGRIVSKRVYGGCRAKNMQIRLWAKGEAGSFTLYVREYPHVARPDPLKWVAIAMAHKTHEDWREYSTVVAMAPWHGDDAIRLDLDGRGVLVDNLSVDIVEENTRSQKERPPLVCAIPPCRQPPIIDGKYSPDEWAAGIHFDTGLIDIVTGLAIPAQNSCHIMSDRSSLYICLLAPIPPGGFVCRERRRDGKVYADDSFEVYVNPTYPAKAGDRVVYQVVTNLAGVVFDMAQRYDMGQMDSGWTCKGLQVSRGTWHGGAVIEMSIPAASVGLGDMAGEWGMNVCRNFARTKQFTSLTGSTYRDFDHMLRCRLEPGAPSLSWGYGGRQDRGRFVLTVRVGNPGTSELGCRVHMQTGPVVKEETSRALRLAPGASEDVRLDLQDQALTFGTFSCKVTKPDGAILFQHHIPFKTDGFHEVQRAFAQGRELRLEYYPIQSKFNVRIPSVPLGERSAYGKTTLFIESPEDEQRSVVVATPRFVEDAGHVTIPLDLPADQPHIVRVLVQGAEGDLLYMASRTVEKRDYAWLSCDLGNDRVVVPPFTPMRYVDPSSVECWGRRYELGRNGLPAQIISAGEPLLASPVSLLFTTGDGRQEPTSATCAFTERTPDRCELRSEVDYPGLRVRMDGWLEYDGCLWYGVELVPKAEVRVAELTLDIPVTRPDSLHAVADAIRSNSTFAFLDSKDGLLWSSKGIKNRQVYGNFLPYVWVGTPARGICWFADNDRGWVNDPEHPCIEIVRSGETVHLLLNLITGPYALRAPRRIELGLMATPTRPRLTGARRHPQAQYTASFGGFFNCGLVPLDPHISQLLLKGRGDSPGAFHVYTAGQQYVMGDPQFNYLTDEIAHEPFSKYTLGLGSKKYKLLGDQADRYISFTVSWSPERVNYNLYHIGKLFDLGLDGVYLDNSYPSFTRNIQHPGGGYVREDGHVQSGCHIMLTREYIKRCTVLAHLKGKRAPRFSVHATDAMVIPAFAFADMFLAGEMSVPKARDHMDMYSPAKLRILLGTHWGPTPSMLTMLGYGESGQDLKRNRAMMGIYSLFDLGIYWNSTRNKELWAKAQQIHEQFGNAEPDTIFVGYWQAAAAAVSHDQRDHVKAGFYVRPGKAALVTLTNFSRERKSVRVGLDLSRFGIASGKLVDAETGDAMQPAGGGYHVKIGAHDFRRLLMTAGAGEP